MMRICQITTVHSPFDGRIFHKECVSLAEAGFEVYLVATHDKVEKVKGVQMIPLPKSRGRFHRIFIKTFLAFLKALKTKAKICHIHDPELLLVGLALKLCGRKVIFDMHELVYHQIADKHYIRFGFIKKITAGGYKLIERLGVRYFDTIILAEDGYKAYFDKHYSKYLDKVKFIRNYPIIGLIDNAPKVGGIQSDQARPFTLVYVGGLTSIRSIREICDAVMQVNEPVKLILAGRWGDNSYKATCNIDNDRVLYLGNLPLTEVFGVLKNSDLGLSILYPVENYLTSLPVKAFEYMACGLPMLMSDFPYWKDTFGPYAQFVNPTSVSDIAGAIEWAIKNPEALKRQGNLAFEKVRRDYSWENESKSLIEIYRNFSTK